MALTAGSIAFIGFNADGNDGFAFITIDTIPAGTVIHFQDNEWNGQAIGSGGAFNTGEGSFTWTNGSNDLTSGTVVEFLDVSSTSRSVNIGTLSGGTTALGNSGESIFAFVGTSATSPTTFLAAITNNNGGFNSAVASGLLSGTGLTEGSTALVLPGTNGADVATYNPAVGGSTFVTRTAALTAFNTASNWVAQDAPGSQDADNTTPDVPFRTDPQSPIANVTFTIGSFPTVTLSVSSTTGSEAGQTVITVTATASSAVSGDQSVNLGITGLNIAAADYSLSSSTIAIPNGQTTGSVSFTVADDALVEDSETAILTISNPSAGIVLGTTTSATVMIADNDTAPSETIDLSTYVRIGRYDLPEPTRTTAPTGSELAQEVSAVTYNPDTDTLFVVGDEGTSIVQISKTGQLINSMSLAAGAFDDTEGLTYVGAGKFALVEERLRQVNLFTYTPDTTLTRADVQSVKLGTTVGNVGLEGLSYNLQTGGFILVKETTPQGIFQTNIDFAAGTATNGSPTTENSTNLFDPALAGLTDIADVYALANFQSTDNNLLVLSQEDGRIINIDRITGETASYLQIVADPGNPLSVSGQGFEGVTLDSNGLLYVTSEQGGGDGDHPQLWVYAPASYVYSNAAPVAVSLSNAVTSLAENSDTSARTKVGNIIISDDALGTNTLSLTGADAGAFEIDGTALYLKAGTALDFETKPNYEVTVNVDDATVGSSPDASTTFTLEITDTTDTPATLIISEVAPWSSGNSPGVAADWFEVTNISTSAIDITGWRIDDDSASFANSSALGGVTSIAPGQSVVFVDGDANKVTAFVNAWFGGTLPNGVAIGTYGGPGLGTGGDAVNLFDASGTLVTGVTFGASPAASPFASFDNAGGLSSVAALSIAGVNGAFSVIDAGGNAAAILTGSPGAISGSPVVTTLVAIAATDAAAAEAGQNPGTFTFLRTGDTTTALDVTYTIGGNASAADYTPSLPTTITIPAGASQTTITITPVDDALNESTESVTLALGDTANYDVAANAASATVTIADNDAAIANFNLQVTETWSGNSVGSDLTADWFEITNTGTEAWVSGVSPDLYYDDSPPTPANAVKVSGITQIDPGESVVVVIGTNADAQTFSSVWGSVIDLTGVDIGYAANGAGLGANGDGVSLFVGLPETGAVPADYETYPAGSTGRSYDVGLAAFSTATQNGAVATAPNNEGQSAVGSPGNGMPIAARDANAFISEFHYDNTGTDTGEFIEVTADAGADLTGYSLVLYNGNGGASYATYSLNGIVADQANGQGTVLVDTPGLQNGSPDGIALVDVDGNVVEFISYEGPLTATAGPAAGMTSTDVGVVETGNEPVGQSLQRIGDTWTGPATASKGQVNAFNLQVTEIWPGQSGTDVTGDWFEITNVGNAAWVSGVDPNLYYDDDSAAPGEADLIQGITRIDPGESVVVVVGNASNATTFTNVWGEVIDLTGVEVGYTDGAGLGDGGDTVTLFVGGPTANTIADSEPYPDTAPFNGASYDVTLGAFSVAGQNGAVGTEVLGGNNAPAVGSPGNGTPIEPVVLTLISAIQGSGAASPITGQLVTIGAIVVGDFQLAGSTQNLRGFYVQEEDSDIDANALTSEGLFIFDDTFGVDVKVGDRVQITGTVAEYTSGTSSLTELTNLTNVTIIDTGNALPSATILDFPLVNPAGLEAYEGMRVTISDTLTVTEHYQLGRYGQVVLSSEGSSNQAGTDNRLDQFTQFNAPSVAGYSAYLEEIAKRRIVLDDAQTIQNPDPIINARNGQPLSATNTLRGGDTVTGLTGILDDRFGDDNVGNYRIQATAAVDFQATNARPTTAPDVGGTLKVASFNLLNYFNGDGLGGGFTSLEQRGAENLAEFNRQRDKTIAAILGMDADVVGLVEIENDGYGTTSAIQDLVNGLNAVAGAGTYAFVNPGLSQLGSDAIAGGFIYQPGKVTPVGNAVTVADGFGQGAFDANNRKPLAQTFQDNATGAQFTPVINHLKSKGSSAGRLRDADAGDGQGLSNETRTRAAEDLAAWLATNPTGTADPDYLILGDLNAYAQEDPITALETAGYSNLLTDTTYSYVFNGQWGSLDHALATASLAGQVTGAAKWHINADEPSVLDYNTNFKSAGQITSLYDDDAFRSSDHDPVIVGLNLTSPVNVINGTAGRDSLTGTPGNDVITGGAGGDIITTGAGRDKLVYTSTRDAGDRITDFDGIKDKLVFTDLLTSLGYSGSNPVGAGYLSFVNQSGSAIIRLDGDGLGSAAVGRNFLTLEGVTLANNAQLASIVEVSVSISA